jgi:hypothetical protein
MRVIFALALAIAVSSPAAAQWGHGGRGMAIGASMKEEASTVAASTRVGMAAEAGGVTIAVAG